MRDLTPEVALAGDTAAYNATEPSYQSMGYATDAMLEAFWHGAIDEALK